MDILKPIYGEVWAASGEKLAPGSDKLESGWILEMMPYQYENFLQNRQDVAITYLMQKGVAEWSGEQEYTANKSVVQYQGHLYIATSTTTNVVPTTTASWRKLTVSIGTNGAIPVAFGGTGATTAAQARVNLGIGSAGALDLPSANGMLVKLANNTLASRTIVGTEGYIDVVNGDGTAGNPTINVGANVAKTNADASWTTTGSIRLPTGTTAQRGVAAAGRIRFNLDSSVFEGYDGTSWNPVGSTGVFDVQNFSGDNVTTTFTLSSTPRSENNTQVYINGVYQQKNTYNLTNNSLTFSVPPMMGVDNIEVVTATSITIGTTTAGQTSITDSGNYYNSGNVEGALQEVGSSLKSAILSFNDLPTAELAARNLPNGQLVNVVDEQKQYKVESGALVFVANLDQLRIDLADPAKGPIIVAEVNSFAELRALERPKGKKAILVFGRDDSGDIEPTHFLWVPASSKPDNDVNVIAPNFGDSAGRWEHGGRVDIRLAGAKSGAATSQHAQIQKAIDALESMPTSSRSHLWVPEGEFLLDIPNTEKACCWISFDNAKVFGAGENAILKTAQDWQVAILVSPQNNLAAPAATGEISGFEMHGVHAKGTGHYTYYGISKGRGVLLQRVKKASVHHNWLSDFSMVGLCLESGLGYVDFSHNQCHGNKYSAINFNGRCYMSFVAWNICSGSNAGVNSLAIQVDGPSACVGNQVMGHVTNYANCGGISYGEGNWESPGVVSLNVVSHCRFGIKAVFHGPCSITSNTIIACRTQGGIFAIGGTSGGYTIRTSNCIIAANMLMNNSPYQIESSAEGVIISDNQCLNRVDAVSPSAPTEPDYIPNVTVQTAIRIRAAANSVHGNMIDGASRGVSTTVGQEDGVIGPNTMRNVPQRYSFESQVTGSNFSAPTRRREEFGGGYKETVTASALPFGFYPVGSEWENTSIAVGGQIGAKAIQNRSTTAELSVVAGGTSITTVDKTTFGVTAQQTVSIGMRLDNGQYHWTTAASSNAGVLTLSTGIPAGRSITVGAEVYVVVWRTLGVLV